MNKKILIISAVCAGLVCYFGLNSIIKNHPSEQVVQEENVSENTDNKHISVFNFKKEEKAEVPVQNAKIEKTTKITNEPTIKIKKSDLYSNATNNSLPLSGIYEISSLPENVKNTVNSAISSSDGVFLIKKVGNKVLVISDNQKSIRHGVDFVEISTTNGQQTITSLGYLDKMKDSNNDNWEYDKNGKPIKHIIYNNDGDVEYIETWNYTENSPVKYEMKDGNGNIVSIKKETIDNDSNNLRVEHIIYDNAGNTKVNVSATYEGADIKRFTYYNADKLNESSSIFGEYQDGQKVKETVYSSDLKVKNVYSSDYDDNGERTDIKVFDSQNNEIEQIIKK